MKNIKLFDLVIVLKDKKFLTPEEIVKKGTLGYVVEIINKPNLPTGFIVELVETDFDSPIFDFHEDEIDLYKQKNKKH